MFVCCDCKKEIPEALASTHTLPNSDGSATIQCVPCHVNGHETSNGKHEPLFSALKKNRAACWACSVPLERGRSEDLWDDL